MLYDQTGCSSLGFLWVLLEVERSEAAEITGDKKKERNVSKLTGIYENNPII